jgi:hypothetical protein
MEIRSLRLYGGPRFPAFLSRWRAVRLALLTLGLVGPSTGSYVRCVKDLAGLLTRYWGYLAVVVAVAGFALHSFGLAVILILSAAALGYFLLGAPVWCGAETRTGEHCRRNSYGLLRGCTFRQHKWQRLKQTFTPAGARAVISTCKSVSGGLAGIGGVVAGVQVLIAAAELAFH